MSPAPTADLIDRLLAAGNEVKATIREAHEVRRDLRLAITEANEKLGKVREEVATAVDQLALEKSQELFAKVDIEKVATGLKRTLDQWLKLLGEAKEVLDEMKSGTRRFPL